MHRVNLVFVLILSNVFCKDVDYKIVELDEGLVKGEKYWNGDYYEFYGIPYATVPKGRDKFQGPLPPKPWSGLKDANLKHVACPQLYYTGDNSDEVIIVGEQECLVVNVFTPKVASDDILRPVIAYIHSGAFAIGNGNIAGYQYLVRRDVVIVSFNYRLGALGFACLGNEDIPGNAGLKDQVAALKWINKNIRKFGGDPKKVTVAGFSVGAAMAELLSLSKLTDGLFDKIILESGSALSPWAINSDPITTARHVALSLGYNETGKFEDLTEFYFKASEEALAAKSLNFFWKNGTFGYAPCIENVHNDIEPFITESPIDIIRKGTNRDVAILTGFSNMEGLSRVNHFEEWGEEMNENFQDFLPVDLKFPDEISKNDFVKDIKDYYFKGEDVSPDTLQGYIDYNSDFMFKYSIMKSAKMRSMKHRKPVYIYEFCYVGKLNTQHNFMDLVKGASHRDQTSYILDFQTWTGITDDLNIRDRMTLMWADFAEYEDPTAFESPLVDFKWMPYTNEHRNYLHINNTVEIKRDLFEESYKFWDAAYRQYYLNPSAPEIHQDLI